tara:strand:+ start:15315 stop:15623 length:309 start_codon:yes stop_codon:yes gene_type:complete
MIIPIFKKTKFETMNKDKQTIADDISIEDKEQICVLMKQFIKHKDARGRWQIPKNEGRKLLVYFRKYVDPKIKDNIFGCGGCATKMVNYMFDIYKLWQNPIK